MFVDTYALEVEGENVREVSVTIEVPAMSRLHHQRGVALERVIE